MLTLEKELPNAPNAERVILGSVFLNPSAAANTVLQLCLDDFYSPINRVVFTAMREMLEAGKDIDPILLADHLHDQGESNITPSELNDLIYGVPPILRLEHYIKQVKEKARLRMFIKKISALIARIYDGESNVSEIVQEVMTSFDEIAQELGDTPASIFTSFADLMKQEIPDSETIAFHACRGEIVLVQSVTNRGKSTLVRNAAIALAEGGEFLSVVEKVAPCKVVLFNYEGSMLRFQNDLKIMTRDFPPAELDLIRDNLFSTHAPSMNGEPFTLPMHMPQLKAQARKLKPDVIILDTTSAAFSLKNENDNAEIQGVMKSLTRLARELNCLVILVHHIGKAKLEEGLTREPAHRGRGASSLADFATTIFNLEADARNPDQVILECAKRKDGEPYARILALNRTTRWFSMTDQTPQSPSTSYDLVIEAIKGFEGDVKRVEIDKALAGKVARATISRCLNEAVSRGDIIKTGHGLYLFNGNAHQAQLI